MVNWSNAGFADESTRVCLQPIRGVDGSDYINASFVNVSRSSLLVVAPDELSTSLIATAVWGATEIAGRENGGENFRAGKRGNRAWKWKIVATVLELSY